MSLEKVDVLLVLPPFASLNMPSIGLSLIEAVLRKNHIPTEVLYANLIFAEEITLESHNEVFSSSLHNLVGEWLFSLEAFPSTEKAHQEYGEFLNGLSQFVQVMKKFQISKYEKPDFPRMEELIKIRKLVPSYLKQVVKLILDKEPKIVGLSTSFQQTCASIAIARMIKETHPEIITVLGGNNCTRIMGETLLKTTNKIDYIFSGEADLAFYEFCLDVFKKNFPESRFIECPPVENLDSLPYPDYSDYYIQIENTELREKTGQIITFESSRGCWWGASSHCLFCALNRTYIQYRKKTPQRIRAELQYLIQNYKIYKIMAVDTILSREFPIEVFKEFEKPEGLKSILYQVRPIFNFKELFFLARSGIKMLQPGIENLSERLLIILNKRLKTLDNIRFLRDCMTLSIVTQWNFLFAIPGETREDYEESLKIIPFIFHLQPPYTISPLAIQRFSPLFKGSKRFKIENLHASDAYSYIFPKNVKVEDLALVFEGDYENAFDNEKLKKKFFSIISKWKKQWESTPYRLYLLCLNDENFLIEDTRPISKARFRVLKRRHFEILKFLREPKEKEKLNSLTTSQHLKKELKQLMKWKYILHLNGRYLSLVIEPMRILEMERELGEVLHLSLYSPQK